MRGDFEARVLSAGVDVTQNNLMGWQRFGAYAPLVTPKISPLPHFADGNDFSAPQRFAHALQAIAYVALRQRQGERRQRVDGSVFSRLQRAKLVQLRLHAARFAGERCAQRFARCKRLPG